MGSGKKKTTQTYTPAGFIESGAKQATSLATDYASQPFQGYATTRRVADLAPGEKAAIDLSQDASGGYREDLDAARGALGGVEYFDQFDPDVYMSPYIKGALDPAARELREEGLRREQDLAGSLSSRGAFSGSRAALAGREQAELTQQGISDLYGRGYQQAFESGTALWQADQDRRFQQAQAYGELAGLGSDLVDKDIARLMETGETQRYVDQLMKDFDYQQFVEQRDWGGKQAAYLTDVLRGLKGSYTEVTQTKTKEKGNVLGQVLGAATTIAGAYFTGGASLAAGAAGGAAAGAATGGAALIGGPGGRIASGGG